MALQYAIGSGEKEVELLLENGASTGVVRGIVDTYGGMLTVYGCRDCLVVGGEGFTSVQGRWLQRFAGRLLGDRQFGGVK